MTSTSTFSSRFTRDAQKHYILAAVANLTTSDLTPARVKDIHAVYQRVCEAYATDPLSQRGMYNHLTKLAMLGFLTSYGNNEGIKGGQYYEFEFSDEVSTEKVKEAFDRLDLNWVNVRTSGQRRLSQ